MKRKTLNPYAVITLAAACLLSFSGCTPDKEIKIAVVGAGASGLTAAHTLKTNGYLNVTVFEREAQAGGKAHSYNYNGRIFELGAALFDETNYAITVELAAAYGVEYEVYQRYYVLDPETGPDDCALINLAGECILGSLDPLDGLKVVALAFFNGYWINAPGFARAHPASTENMDSFLDGQGLAHLKHMVRPYTIAYGYGYFDEVPAMYYMKYMNILADTKVFFARFPGGWQTLFTTMAAQMNVRYNAEVTGIRRFKEGNAPKVEITVNHDPGTAEVFDRVLISAPLHKAETFMDLTAEEAALFEKIITYEYWVTLIKLRTPVIVEPAPSYAVEDHLYPSKKGHILLIYNFIPGENIYNVYQLNDWSLPPEEMFALMKEDIEALGGEIDEDDPAKGIIAQKRWDYFPHVNTSDLNAGFYPALENLQGAQGTYFIGALMNFETVELTAQYARNLVNRYFPKL